jgi:DNA polymerase-4
VEQLLVSQRLLVFVQAHRCLQGGLCPDPHGYLPATPNLIQPLSLDEAYLDVTAPLLDLGSATAIAAAI